MSSETWTEDNPFVRLVLARPREFDFFQLLHLIERIERDAAPIGRQGPAHDEPVRLRPALNLGFPCGDLEEARWLDDVGNGYLQVTTTFLGLYGSDSPLPAHFTEALLGEQEEDERVRNFIDLFHHRLLSLLYRVWKKYRYYVTFRTDGSDAISQVVRGFLGIGTPRLDESLEISPLRLFRYVGLLSQRPRSAAGLIGQLADFFDGIDFDMEQCVGRWIWIQPNDRNSLGVEKCRLGENFLLGERIFDRSGKFRVKVGPVGFDDYAKFLPSGSAAAELAEIVRFYCEDPLEHDIEVTLRGAEVPETPLGEPGLLGRLSWTTWLKSQPSKDKSVIFSAATRGDTP
ncbi:MAG: type VI secretion system baseplate subunit TssG [Planctomycetes bacterium]|nr:type VI secretion system baseplate subunit TssG [Planctomycetota bacterium]